MFQNATGGGQRSTDAAASAKPNAGGGGVGGGGDLLAKRSAQLTELAETRRAFEIALHEQTQRGQVNPKVRRACFALYTVRIFSVQFSHTTDLLMTDDGDAARITCIRGACFECSSRRIRRCAEWHIEHWRHCNRQPWRWSC